MLKSQSVWCLNVVKQYHQYGIDFKQPIFAMFFVQRNSGGSFRTFSSQRMSNQYQSLVFRKHGTSSPHSAEATLASSIAFRNRINPELNKRDKMPSLPANMVLRYCSTAMFADHLTLKNGSIAETTSPRPLLLLFAWMLAKDEHIQKYRDFWFKRGYDVLSVRTSPMSLLLPGIGGRQNALSICNILANHRPFYDEILVHAFSVGGYQLCELLNVLEQDSNQMSNQIYDSIKGLIIDSCVYPEDAPPGLSRAVTKHFLLQPMLEKSIRGFLKLTKPFTLDRYKRVESTLFSNIKQIPGLMFYSKDDPVSNVRINQNMHEGWKQNGTMADYFCWEKSTHVLHFKEHPTEYQNKVDEFVSKLKITKAKTIS